MQFGVGLKDVVGPMFVDTQSYKELSEDLRKKIDSTVQSILDVFYAITIVLSFTSFYLHFSVFNCNFNYS